MFYNIIFKKKLYFPFFSFCIWTLLWFAIQKQFGIHEWNPHYLACLVSMGPILIAQTMANLTENSKKIKTNGMCSTSLKSAIILYSIKGAYSDQTIHI